MQHNAQERLLTAYISGYIAINNKTKKLFMALNYWLISWV